MSTIKNKSKGFGNQILVELKRIFASKFNIILAALILLGSIAVPIISKIQPDNSDTYYYYDYSADDITVNGVTVTSESPMYWEVRNYQENIEYITKNATTEADDLTLEFMNNLLESTVVMAAYIESYEDYRYELTWERNQLEVDKFVLSHLDEEKEDLMEAIMYYTYYELLEFEKRYFSLSQIEVLEWQDELDEQTSLIDDIMINNDYIKYYEFQIQSYNINYEENLETIAALEQDIIENPDKEEIYSEQIESYELTNSVIADIEIPIYEYRIENEIIPDSDDWRDSALDAKRNAMRSLVYNTQLTQEEFEENEYYRQEFVTYSAYQENWQETIDKLTQKLYVAEHSLETGKPDMAYVDDGARSKKASFLWYSLIIAVFGVFIGGGLMSKEFQSGTIRLLLIRPKTRVKMFFSKFLALLGICMALYLVCDILNALTTGALFGFSDYSFPNYTISSGAGGINFWGYYAGKFLMCSVSVLFASGTAFFLSSVTRNTAVSVAVPLVCFVGSLIAMEFLTYSTKYSWVAYTPIPYVNISRYFINDTTYWEFSPILGFGIPLMIGLSLALIGAGVYIFNKRDVTN